MSRFKFRLFDNEKKEMIYPNGGDEDERFVIDIDGYLFEEFHHEDKEYADMSVCDADEYEIMLRTGLRDKNDTDIYEGDILYYTTILHEVIWERGAFFLRAYGSGKRTLLGDIAKDHVEVVGNIQTWNDE